MGGDCDDANGDAYRYTHGDADSDFNTDEDVDSDHDRHEYRAGYTELLGALRAGADAQQLLALQERFRVLCALREGEFGVAGLNRAINCLATIA